MSSVERAIDAMNASLRREYNRIRTLLKTDPESVEVRHAVGLVVAAIKRDPERYGKQAVGLLGTALGRDEATLYRFAQVASRWTVEELAQWIERGRAADNPLSWWHFVEASAVSRTRARDDLLRRAIQEGLSVRVLSRLAEKARHPRGRGSRLVREVEVLVDRTTALREGWEHLRAASIDEIRRMTSPDVLERALASHAALVAESKQALAEVEALQAAIRLGASDP